MTDWILTHPHAVSIAWKFVIAFGLVVLVAERIDYFMPEIRWSFKYRTAWRLFAPMRFRRQPRPRPVRYEGQHRHRQPARS